MTIALVALYALALQSVFHAGAVSAGPDPLSVLCVERAETGGGSSEAPAKSAHPLCCILSHGLAKAAPPIPASVAIVWPARLAIAIDWERDFFLAPRAPPSAHARARAPPVA